MGDNLTVNVTGNGTAYGIYNGDGNGYADTTIGKNADIAVDGTTATAISAIGSNSTVTVGDHAVVPMAARMRLAYTTSTELIRNLWALRKSRLRSMTTVLLMRLSAGMMALWSTLRAQDANALMATFIPGTMALWIWPWIRAIPL
ncbi:hypothetical protein [uncultured Mitsuokella sp.]|uniref:hypothetical protein n=1 Tax=uncultured Mitsuokella sp. TaxID=453120 RepID=UPI0025D83388|nr:hypothetical protein [uncultured Mitsuokella sp.]